MPTHDGMPKGDLPSGLYRQLWRRESHITSASSPEEGPVVASRFENSDPSLTN